MNLLNDWRFLVVAAALLWGCWGFLAKVASVGLEWRTALLFVGGTNFLVILAVTVGQARFQPTWSHAAAVAAGLCGAAGAVCFYRALPTAEASVAIAVSAQYVLVTTVLSWAILHEPFSLRKLLGLVLAVVAIMLLTGKEPGSSVANPRVGGNPPRALERTAE